MDAVPEPPAAPTRRDWLRWGCARCAALLGTAALAGHAPAAAAEADAPEAFGRLQRPSADTDEGGLWALMEREEGRLRRSPLRLRDSALDAYLSELLCRLGGAHCADIRVYVMRTPMFNASMAPNGMMQVWTGLLLRVDNEAQLAAVLGHELAHYLERHSLQQLRDMRGRAAFAQFAGLFGVVGVMAQMGTLAGAFGFSREQESRADELGLRFMQRAGLDGAQAAQVWDNLLGELRITSGDEALQRHPMSATHPAPAGRRDRLLQLAGGRGGELGIDVLRRMTERHRLDWLHDELRRGQFDESTVLFDRQLRQRPGDVLLLYARGEARRQRDQAADLPQAVADLTQAVNSEGAPPVAWRSLGQALSRQGRATEALPHFERYLSLAPDASDADLIRSQMAAVRP